MSDISVNIDHVVLDGIGVQPQSGERLGRQIEIALHHMLEQQGFPSGLSGRDVAEIAGPSIHLPPSATDGELAESVALALYRALGMIG